MRQFNDVFKPEAVTAVESKLEFGSRKPVLAMKPHSVCVVEVRKSN